MTDIAVDAVPEPDSANVRWKDLHTESYTPRIWGEAGISEIFIFFCPLIMAFERLPQFIFQSWLLSVLSQGRKLGKKK